MRLVLPADVSAASVARRFLAEQCPGMAPDTLADAQLLVSEIVTNAVLHGLPEIILRIQDKPPALGIAISDAGPNLATQKPSRPPTAQPSGRGLLIVDAIATAWGITPTDPPPGKTVPSWFEL